MNHSARLNDLGKTRDKVLVLGSDTRSFLSVIRSLGRRGLDVHVAWHSDESPAARSRYIRVKHQLPTPWDSPNTWKAPFCELLQIEGFDLVIPCNDPSLIPLQDHRDEVERFARIACLNDSAYAVAFDKQESIRLAESLGISVADSRLICDSQDAGEAVETFGFPLILKPLKSYTADRLGQRNNVYRVENRTQMDKRVRELSARGPILAQEFFAGIGAGVEFLAYEGRLLATFQHVRLHEPESGGGSSHRKSETINPELLEATEELVAALEYTGVGMVEFRIDPASGRWIFIEINGRFWGSLPLAIASGADFPSYLYDCAVHGRHEFPQSYRVGIRCRNLMKDVAWYRERFVGVLRRRRGLWRFGRDVVSDLLGLVLLRERSDTFVLDDLRPGFAEMQQLTGMIVTRSAAKLGAGIRRLPPVTWWQGSRARQAFQRARRIVFICKGNICRSPFAEHYLRGLLPASVDVSSCGYFPQSDRPSPAAALRAADNFGVSLETHRSRVVCESDLEAADVIFVFDEENRRTIRTRFPQLKKRIHLLGCLNSRGPLHIADPYGGDELHFRQTYQTIKNAVDTVVAFTAEPSAVSAEPHIA